MILQVLLQSKQVLVQGMCNLVKNNESDDDIIMMLSLNS